MFDCSAMSAKAIREATGKDIINRNLGSGTVAAKCKFASVTDATNFSDLASKHPWLNTEVTPFICPTLNICTSKFYILPELTMS